MTDFTKNYNEEHHTYPIFSQSLMYEGAVKRFRSLPTPKEVFDYAMIGLPKQLPLTNELITFQGVVDSNGILDTSTSIETLLASAIVEIEMGLGCSLTPVVHSHPVDYIEGMFGRNHGGINLPVWPATEVISVDIKYPQAGVPSDSLFLSYQIPPNWISLSRNKINIAPTYGTLAPNSKGSQNPQGGFSGYGHTFYPGPYKPRHLEILYKTGFENDKVPIVVFDMIRVAAAKRYLEDIIPVLFPTNSVSTQVDSVSQSASYSVVQNTTQRIASLDKKFNELKKAFRGQFSRNFNFSIAGV